MRWQQNNLPILIVKVVNILDMLPRSRSRLVLVDPFQLAILSFGWPLLFPDIKYLDKYALHETIYILNVKNKCTEPEYNYHKKTGTMSCT